MKNVRPIAPRPKKFYSRSYISLNKLYTGNESFCNKVNFINRETSFQFDNNNNTIVSDFSKELLEFQEIQIVNDELYRILNNEVHYPVRRKRQIPRASNPFLTYLDCE